MTQRSILGLSALAVSLGGCTPELWAEHEGPLITLSQAHPAVEYELALCIDAASFDAYRPLDAWAHLHADGEGDWSLEARNESFGQGGGIDYERWESYETQVGLNVQGPWVELDGMRCMAPQVIHFELDRAPTSGTVALSWQVHFGAQDLERSDDFDSEVRFELLSN